MQISIAAVNTINQKQHIYGLTKKPAYNEMHNNYKMFWQLCSIIYENLHRINI